MIPYVIAQSELWTSTLGSREQDQFFDGRERLRSSFLNFRERATYLAAEIRKDLPDLTVHDITHLDALWDVASQVTGKTYSLTPTEAYVLGGAFLLHDIAMSIAATPGGVDTLQADARWSDLIYSWYQEKEKRDPTSEEVISPSSSARQYALFNLLRLKHAENAEKLAFQYYKGGSGNQIFLIEDTELRQTFGQLIGQIAHSHWWPIDLLEEKFSRISGAPPWAPTTWTVDPLKIACILRAADAAHIDARRAPLFLRAISKLSNSSEQHWIFQEKLNKPYITEDSLVFTSSHGFPLNEANAWWMCLETLRMVDKELRGIDALLADKSQPRFLAKRVAGVDSPERLAGYVQTACWLPINATVHISDLPHIISSIGGEELYGQRPTVPLRELIQNASDAVRARRVNEGRAKDFGEIVVSVSQDDTGFKLRVADNGIGMSRRVLTDFLLDFGRSFWASPEVQEEFPGLLSSGFKATGKYGIGFFSIFMVADKVTVITRRPDCAKKDTLVLEFGSGLQGRPILRTADVLEQLLDGGTSIELRLKTSLFEKGGLLYAGDDSPSEMLIDLCRRLAPALDVSLFVEEDGKRTKAIEANDWMHIEGTALLDRLGSFNNGKPDSGSMLKEIRERAAENLTAIKDENGNVIARCCISIGYAGFYSNQVDTAGCIVVGGLTSSELSGIAGVMLGTPERASRDAACPLVSNDALALWATEQADLVAHLWATEELQMSCAQNIRICGGHTKSLPIAKIDGKWVSAMDIEMMDLPSTIILVDEFTVRYSLRHVPNLVLHQNVIVTNTSGMPVIFQNDRMIRHENSKKGRLPLTLSGAVVESIAKRWGITTDAFTEADKLEHETEVSIGLSDGKEILERAIVVAKPNPPSVSAT
jgi:hypothetical protein